MSAEHDYWTYPHFTRTAFMDTCLEQRKQTLCTTEILQRISFSFIYSAQGRWNECFWFRQLLFSETAQGGFEPNRGGTRVSTITVIPLGHPVSLTIL
jgi:hypothetical protein